MLAKDHIILSIVECCKILFDTIPHQIKTPENVCENWAQEILKDMEVS